MRAMKIFYEGVRGSREKSMILLCSRDYYLYFIERTERADTILDVMNSIKLVSTCSQTQAHYNFSFFMPKTFLCADDSRNDSVIVLVSRCALVIGILNQS